MRPMSLHVRSKKKPIKQILTRLSVSLGVLFIIAISSLLVVYSKGLPGDSELMQWRADEATRIFDRNGNLLYQVYGDEKRITVPSDQISDNLKEATIAIEDARFYQHPGVDLKGIVRATYKNLAAQSNVEGGSTITQQLAKNAFLTSDRTWTRKVREIILAFRLEHRYSKEEILTMYLNEVSYGGNASGAQAAAMMYFGKHAKELTIAEAATLAGLTKAPTYYSPYGSNKDKLTTRRDHVIDRMLAQGLISDQEATTAKADKIAVKPKVEQIKAPHFAMYVTQLLRERYGDETVEKGGLQVTTTLDPDKQKLAEQVIAEADPVLKRSRASNAALVALDPKTGQILAMVGSRDYFDQAHDGNVNVTISARPPGSAFKPVVYAAGFDKGPWAPGSTLFDVQTNFGTEKMAYIPNNYDGKFHGAVSIRQALGNSYNIPAVKMMDIVGKEETLTIAKRLGINTLNDPNRYGLSLVIGGGDVKLLELAGAYGAFANNGAWQESAAIIKVTQGGKVLFEHQPEPKQIFRPQVAYQISSILSDNEARKQVFGSNSPLVLKNHKAAVKTGTTQDYRDAWTIGYTPSLVAGVWVGNNDFSVMAQGSAGAMAAAPLWNSFMTKALAGHSNEDFAIPNDLQTLAVDAVTGGKPTTGTRQTRQDIFAAWQVPPEAQYASYRVYDCQGNLKEERGTLSVHSEKPGDARWEKPVQAWAQANGFATGKAADVHENCDEPPVEIANEPPSSAVGGAQTDELPLPDMNPRPIPSFSLPPLDDTNFPRPNRNRPFPQLPLSQLETDDD